MKKKFVIIDGNAIVHRAYHAIPPLTTKDGTIVNAVYGFASMLLKVWNQLKPEYLAVTFDMPGKTFRHEKFTEYKATRVKADQELYDQIPLAHELVEIFNIPIYEKAGFEADDVIGTISKQVENVETFIVTGDMDILQLVDKNISAYTLRKGMSDIVIYDPARVVERFGFGPDMIVDYKALRGDSSDNIPGVSGIGKKTATQLIQKIGGVDKIYKRLRNPELLAKDGFKPGAIKKLKEGQEDAVLSRELAEIDCAVPKLNFKLQDCVLSEFDKDKVLKFFQEFEFVSLLKRVPGLDQSKVKSLQTKKKGKKVKKEIKFIEIAKSSEIDELVEKIKKEKVFACKEVINGKNILEGSLMGLVFVVDDQGYWLEKKLIKKVEKVFSDKEIDLVGHDLKQLIKALISSEKIEVKNKLFDIMIASYLLNPGNRAHDTASVILKILGKELPAASKQESLFGVDYRLVGQELFLLSQTVGDLKKDLDSSNNLGLLDKLESPLISVLAQVELNGVAIDLKSLQTMSVEAKKEINKISKEIHKLAGGEFNIASPVQLREILFEKLELPTQGIKKGKTGFSTSAEQLEKLHDVHPIISKIESFREISKLQNTYIDVLPNLIDKKTNRIHTNFNQAVTATGRLSSSEPNLQNIPIRTELGRQIREAFVAERGNSLVVADYSQIELRIVASLAKDKTLIGIFEKDQDVHRATAAAINGVKLEKVTKELRSAAKAVNFGVLYGMGSYGLSWRAGMPVWQAKEFIEKYFTKFSGVKKFLDRTLEFAKKEGYCETLFGRRRYIPELLSGNFQLRSAGERMAINHPVQGTAADVMKMAMIKVQTEIQKQKNVKMILQVHDELVLEVKKGLEDSVSEMLKKTMEEVVKLDVPVKVEVGSGRQWGKIK